MFNYKVYKKEKKEQFTFLNSVLGAVSIAIALSCLGTKEPTKWFLWSFPFIIGLAAIGWQIFPFSLQKLREKGKDDPKAKELADHIQKTEYGKVALIRDLFPYTYGFGFYIVVFGLQVFGS